jgi:hypothetical protein
MRYLGSKIFISFTQLNGIQRLWVFSFTTYLSFDNGYVITKANMKRGAFDLFNKKVFLAGVDSTNANQVIVTMISDTTFLPTRDISVVSSGTHTTNPTSQFAFSKSISSTAFEVIALTVVNNTNNFPTNITGNIP